MIFESEEEYQQQKKVLRNKNGGALLWDSKKEKHYRMEDRINDPNDTAVVKGKVSKFWVQTQEQKLTEDKYKKKNK